MPAAAKIEKPASDEMTNGKAKNASNANNGTNHVVSSASMLQEPQKIANSIIEKKIRNLEKRKARLLELKAMEDKGQQLEAEQKIAVKKLENVVEMIDMLKEIGKNVTDGLNEHAKQFKKQQKKEQIEKQAERQQQELERVKFWLYSQLIVAKYLPLDSVKADLEQGKIGEIKIEENQVDAVNKLGDLLAPSNFESVESSVEKLGNLLEGNKREFSTGVSYSDVKELLNQFKESKYFENVSLVVEPVVVSSTESTENVKSLSEESVPSNEPVQSDSDVKSEEEPTEANQDVPQNVHHINNQLCFMRDTRVETELQHKDPAVVAVASLGFPYPPQNGQALSTSSGSSANPSYPPPHIYQTVPIQTQTFQNANYSIPANYIPAIPMATHKIPIPDQIAIPRNVAPDAPTIPISNDNSEVSATKVNGQFSPDSPKEASQDAESKPIANGQFDNRGSFPRGRPRGRGGYSRGGNFNNYHRGGRGGGGNPSENKGNFGGHYNNNNGAPQNFNPNNRPANRPRTENGGGNRPYRQDRGVRNQTNQFNDQAAPVSAK